MTTDIIEVNNFVVLVDSVDAEEAKLFKCQFDDETVGVSIYGSGNVEIEVSYGDSTQVLKSQKGTAFSFYGNNTVRFAHRIHQSEPLRCISIFSPLKALQKLPGHERDLYEQHLGDLWSGNSDFELGPRILMTPEMHQAVSKIFNTPFQDSARLLFLKSQVLELLSHYFGRVQAGGEAELPPTEIEKVEQAREIIAQNIEKPPSLSELSRLIGMNSNKLGKHFKQLFGVPVFKYLQDQRLQKAYQLLDGKEMTVQEVAWFVGYESLSSFSNAFHKKFGIRPSAVGK